MHYDDAEKEKRKEERKRLKATLKKRIGDMTDEDVEFLAGVINNMNDYKTFFELLKKLSK